MTTKGTTHLASGIALSTLTPELSLINTVGLAIGSILPDIDSDKSLIGRHVPILPMLMKHRTVTHTLWVATLLYFVSPPIAIGCVLHILLDLFNPEGVPVFWPIKTKIHAPLIHVASGGGIDKIMGWALWTYNIYFFFRLCIQLA